MILYEREIEVTLDYDDEQPIGRRVWCDRSLIGLGVVAVAGPWWLGVLWLFDIV